MSVSGRIREDIITGSVIVDYVTTIILTVTVAASGDHLGDRADSSRVKKGNFSFWNIKIRVSLLTVGTNVDV